MLHGKLDRVVDAVGALVRQHKLADGPVGPIVVARE